ncbi:NAD(P)-binding domain-containing protein [Curtobacterium sp. MCPF17_002]|uniref:NADPH-dependent F420 reductase n=1 Tax=Curtobacterium sp. MCPF17_002 TaxID=2175645 RepID=UPI000DA7AF19|nr:NAD(P)-binding domain-containing protein [Curtobacterium sp. MCPF17_002]WIB76704.1 NAD(P)-binding domain-containing protein [Curtobacterium sp. MCPF17_002]
MNTNTNTTPTTIAVLGAGRVGTTLARGLAAAGHPVTLGVRDPATTQERWADTPDSPHTPVTVTDVPTAIRAAAVVVNATPGDTSLERLTVLRAELAGRILLDVSNATTRTADGMPGGLAYADGSLGERLQLALPETRVVKGLNTMLFSVMAAPAALDVPPTAFLSGDHADAKAVVRDVLRGLGWQDEWIVDLGPIATASGTESMALIVPSLLGAIGFAPFALSLAR